MKITLVAVSSVDGFITRGEETNIYTWTSPEDFAYFSELRAQARLIILGRNTYEAARTVIKLSPQTLRVVLTHDPVRFASEVVPGQLEFSNETPTALVTRLSSAGYKEALLMGGAQINAAFWAARLVTDLSLTLEPWAFGAGKKLLASQVADEQQRDRILEEDKVPAPVLKLLSSRSLNQQGTLLLEYEVVNV